MYELDNGKKMGTRMSFSSWGPFQGASIQHLNNSESQVNHFIQPLKTIKLFCTPITLIILLKPIFQITNVLNTHVIN